MSFRALFLASLVALCALSTSPSAAQAPSREDEDARTLFSLGNTAYNEGRFRAALDYFQQAYDLSHRPELLFNIGQAADRLRQDRRALDAFTQYLNEVPSSPQREAIEARVVILQEALDAATPAVSPTPEPTPEPAPVPVQPPPPPPAEPRSPAGIIIASGGGALVITGVVFLALGMHDASTVENAPDGSSYADVADAYDRAPTRITVGSILAGVGLAATATGIVLAVRGGSDDDDDHAVALELRATPSGLSLRGSF